MQTYRELAAVNPRAASYAVSGLGDLAVYEARFSDAIRIFGEGVAADLQANVSDRAAAKLVALAHAQNSSEQEARARAAAERALTLSKAVKIRFLAARVFAEARDVARARELAAALANEGQPEPRAYAKIIEGVIALRGEGRRTKSDPPAAIALFTEANTLLDTWIGRFDLGRAYVAAGMFLQADSEFDRCIGRRGELFLDEEPSYGFLPPVYYFQGLARQGLNSEGFAESYRTYLSIRDAAGEDPLLPDVRRRARQ
jgi:tetratricopeptide (TPR) repeat protein